MLRQYLYSMIEIINVHKYSGGLEKAARYIHSKWGCEENFPFYLDAIKHSFDSKASIPKFFLLMKNDKPIGCYGLIMNDFISRHDLFPWFCSLFIEPEERGHEYGKLLLEHAIEETAKLGFDHLYLTTNHDGYYEKYGFKRIEDGIDLEGKPTRIYEKLCCKGQNS